jgi:predicted DCC family thiol-disulfide oxidoreductase YuxK
MVAKRPFTQIARSKSLTSLTPKQQHAIVVYDGDCGICEKCAVWIRRRAPQVEVKSHFDHGLQHIDAVLFESQGQQFSGAPAVSKILLSCKSRLLRFIGHFMRLYVIRNIAAIVYSLVARNRARISRMFGLTACGIPTQRDS